MQKIHNFSQYIGSEQETTEFAWDREIKLKASFSSPPNNFQKAENKGKNWKRDSSQRESDRFSIIIFQFTKLAHSHVFYFEGDRPIENISKIMMIHKLGQIEIPSCILLQKSPFACRSFPEHVSTGRQAKCISPNKRNIGLIIKGFLKPIKYEKKC